MLIPLILSGGSGTRLWPVSREAYPKPFIKLPDGRSLLQKTLDRLVPLGDMAEVVTVTNREHFFATRDEYSGSGLACGHFFVLEPCARNTAPAVAVGVLAIAARHGGDAIVLVLPADHLVPDAEAFAACARQAERLAEQGHLVTFGVAAGLPRDRVRLHRARRSARPGRLSGRAVHREAVIGNGPGDDPIGPLLLELGNVLFPGRRVSAGAGAARPRDPRRRRAVLGGHRRQGRPCASESGDLRARSPTSRSTMR